MIINRNTTVNENSKLVSAPGIVYLFRISADVNASKAVNNDDEKLAK